MLRLKWGLITDPFDIRWVMGDKASIFMLWFYLTTSPTTDGTAPVNIEVYDLDGNKQDTSHWPSITPTYLNQSL
jgi:hypothetical protein